MKFNEIEEKVQEEIINLLNDHIESCASILKKDKCLIPMLRMVDSKQLISLQSRDGTIDVDRAYEQVINKLKQEKFTYAIFSYSTQIATSPNNIVDALKTYVFAPNGLEVSFYTPYFTKGFIKKTIHIEKTILANIVEDVFCGD